MLQFPDWVGTHNMAHIKQLYIGGKAGSWYVVPFPTEYYEVVVV